MTKLADTMTDLKPMKDCVIEVEACLDRIATLKGEHMVACKEIRAEITDAYTYAKQRGVNVRAAKALVKVRSMQKGIETVRSALDADAEQDYALYTVASEEWGTTPLAVAAAKVAS